MTYSNMLLAVNASTNFLSFNPKNRGSGFINSAKFASSFFSSDDAMSLLFSEVNSFDNTFGNPYNLDLSNYQKQNNPQDAFSFDNTQNYNNPVQNQSQNFMQMMMQFMMVIMQMFMQMMGDKGLNTPFQENGVFNDTGVLGNTGNNDINNNPAVPNYIPQGSTAFGNSIANNAAQTANNMSSTGYCYRGVANTLSKSGVNLSGMSAYMGADQLARSPKFKEATVSRNDLKSLPAGAVVVWDKCPGHQHGHISIALGDGREASDHIQSQMTNYGPRFRVFIPVG